MSIVPLRLYHLIQLGVPSNVNYKQILGDLHRLSGVRNAHSLHIWSLSLQKTALSVHIAIGMYRYTQFVYIIHIFIYRF